MPKSKARNAQLMIFKDGTLYHIDLKKSDNIPHNILLAGASGRVKKIAHHFDKILFKHKNADRPEFHIIAGVYKNVPVAAMSIGIGVDNMEIAINELHALFEYDHISYSWTKDRPRINIIRVGTCGTSLPEIPAGALAISTHTLGLDNLGTYYPLPNNQVDSLSSKIEKKFLNTRIGKVNPLSYCSSASPIIIHHLGEVINHSKENKNAIAGITTASPGFFAPEGRQIGRIRTAFGAEEFRKAVQSFNVDGLRIINHEMETSILFRLGYEHLGYNVGAICLVVDNLATDEIITGGEAKEKMNTCIKVALDTLVALS